jgi:hypothetical protein
MVLLVGLVSADLSAAACLLDCDGQTSKPAAPPPACHEAASRDSGGVQLTQGPVVCHHDHQGLTAEPSSWYDTRAFRSVDVALLATPSATSAPAFISDASLHSSAHLAAPAPPGAPLALRL